MRSSDALNATIDTWHKDEARKAQWGRPHDIKAMYRSASFVADSRVVFNIGGNKYRLVTAVDYRRQALFVKFIGTHAEYDKINLEMVRKLQFVGKLDILKQHQAHRSRIGCTAVRMHECVSSLSCVV